MVNCSAPAAAPAAATDLTGLQLEVYRAVQATNNSDGYSRQDLINDFPNERVALLE